MSGNLPTPPGLAIGTEVNVPVADFAVRRDGGTLKTSGLGSCVAVMLHDPVSRVTALAHVLLPSSSVTRNPSRPTKFADEAVPLLVEEMRRAGAAGPLQAKLAGGARMFGALLSAGVNMGARNIEAVRQALRAARIPIVSEDVGGEHGRNVIVDVASFAVLVTSLQRGDRAL